MRREFRAAAGSVTAQSNQRQLGPSPLSGIASRTITLESCSCHNIVLRRDFRVVSSRRGTTCGIPLAAMVVVTGARELMKTFFASPSQAFVFALGSAFPETRRA